MKLKRNALIILILGVLMSVLGFIAPIVYWNNYTSQNGSIGIIGGADAPTYTFMLSALFDGLPFVLILLGISLVVSAGFCLIFSNTVNKHCNINTSVISLGVSGVGALGLVCAFLWFSVVSFGEMSKHPIEYPVSILLGIVCFFAFVVLIAVYLKLRKINWSIKGFCIDILTSIIYLPTFFLCVFIFLWIIELDKENPRFSSVLFRTRMTKQKALLSQCFLFWKLSLPLRASEVAFGSEVTA